jgi:uncharacterized protein YjbI with pentapeptide repeats
LPEQPGENKHLLDHRTLLAHSKQRALPKGAMAYLLIVKDADFSGVDFNGLAIQGCEFHNCDFAGASLDSCAAIDSTFVGCRFDQATMLEIQFLDCRFDQASFVGAAFHESGFANCTSQTRISRVCRFSTTISRAACSRA